MDIIIADCSMSSTSSRGAATPPVWGHRMSLRGRAARLQLGEGWQSLQHQFVTAPQEGSLVRRWWGRRMWRIFVYLNGVNIFYGLVCRDHTFGINQFINHLNQYGFDVFSPVARCGQDFRTGQPVPPERFSEVVGRWWSVDWRRFSECTTMLVMHPWTFQNFWAKMHELGVGIPCRPY